MPPPPVAYPIVASKPKQPAINSAKAALAALEAAAVATSAANKATVALLYRNLK